MASTPPCRVARRRPLRAASALLAFLAPGAISLALTPPAQRQPVRRAAGEAPCAPQAKQLKSLRRPAEGSSETMRFYLHDVGDFDFTEVVQCLLGPVGAITDIDGFDDSVGIRYSEHLGELWVLERLRAHPQRTHDPDGAELHVVGVPAYVSLAASRLGECGGPPAHKQRMSRVRAALEADPHFRRSGGRDFFIHFSGWEAEAVTEELLELLSRGNAIAGVMDKNFHGVLPWEARGLRTVVLPYKAHGRLEGAIRQSRPSIALSERPTSCLFHGKFKRHHEGHYRSMLRDVGLAVPRSSIRNVDFKNVSDPSALAYATAEELQRGQFCLVPAGDTPTSRRLFDALAAGCVPVVLVDFDSIRDNLPFRSTIDWSRIAVFGGSMQCNSGAKDGLLAWMQRLVQTAESFEAMSAEGQATFQETLSFVNSGNGLVSALLAELGPLVGAA